MAHLSHDQELVERLKQRFVGYPSHNWEEKYDEQGSLLHLSLQALDLVQLPPELWQFISLQRLNLNSNYLSSLPAELGQLSTLQWLSLVATKLNSLPAELSQLSSLQELIAYNNQLSSLPAELGQLSNLQSLILSGNQLSSLPAELSQLSNLQELDLGGNQFSSLPTVLFQLPNLQKLSLGNNPFPSLPTTLFQLTHLQELNLYSSNLSSLPATLGQMINLRRLGLPYNQLTTLPAALGQLTHLQHLNLNRNRFSSLPTVLFQLSNLQRLELSENQLSNLPAALGQLTHLQFLDLSENQLSTLPASLSQLSNLQSLYLSNNPFSTLPAPLCQLTTLQYLLLHGNKLSGLPAEFSRLSNLQYLVLSNNQLRNLPDVVLQLTNLVYLHVTYNQLSSLPATLGQLTHLQFLGLEGNQLSSLPASLSQLTNLQELNLQSNQFSSLPTSVGQLLRLQKLNLWGNQLSTLPDALGQLTQLQELNLYGNQFKNLPKAVCQLINLQQLDLRHNQLRSLPAEIGQLKSLRQLELDENQLRSLPAEIGQLRSLHFLNLEDNQLRSLPAEMGQLGALRWLNLSRNQLTTLPSTLGELTHLQELRLSVNQLTTLPASLGQLTHLQHLYLSENPQLQIPPPEVDRLGTTAVLAYLRALPGAVERFEAKLLLVGEGGMGKSSLLRALCQQPFDPALSLTHGTDIGTLQLPHPEPGKPMLTISTWDFGGQEIYQATHQFFLTRRSVYLLVWNARLGPEVCRLRYWLDTINALAPDAKILLVATHADESQPHLDVRRYQQDYTQLVGQCIVSNKDESGISELKQTIAAIAAQTALVGELWPRDWMEAEQELLARSEHYLDLTSFLRICAQHHIGESDAIHVLGPVLHDLGKILFFPDDPLLNQLVVLKPNWISKVISCILDDQGVRQAEGLLAHRELPRIWAADEQGEPYPLALYPVFLRLMERFDLCYPLEPERPGLPATHSLVPLLLPGQRPHDLPEPPRVASEGLERVEIRYTLGFVPTGLMSWLLVRTHRYNQQFHWREGAHLTYHGQQAHLELDAHRREISLIVWGAFPYTFFSILRETLDTILERFQGLYARHEVPCICPLQQKHPHWHDFDLLESQFHNGVTQTVCQSGTRLSLQTLLYGMHANAPDQVDIALQQTQKLVAQTLLMSAEEQQRRFDMIQQSQEFLWHALLRLTNFEMQKEQTPCPSLFLLEREAEQNFNPKDWMSRAYRLRLLCQYPAGPHVIKGESGYALREGKDWWKAMSPWLRRLVTVLKVGVPLGKAVGEVFDQVDTERLANQIDLFNEILTDLPGIDTIDAVSETSGNAGFSVEQHLEGAALRVLFHFLDTADPAHHWHGLDKVYMPDGTILWVCEQHKREFVSPLPTGI